MKRTILKILSIVLLVSISGIIALHIYLLDGINGWFFSSILDFEEDTVYASGYTNKGFRQVKPGMNSQKVVKLLGTPLEVVWRYTKFKDGRVRFENNRVARLTNDSDEIFRKIEKGMRREDVLKILGIPERETWIYSKSPGDKSFRVRTIILKNDEVIEKFHLFYVD